jgi:bifunctional non-homologous end joining protein LigD
VASRIESRYEPGKRSGAWQKMRINLAQGFVIGGYTVGGRTFDALIFGYYDGDRLLYAGRTRNGFTPSMPGPRAALRRPGNHHAGRWGQGLTAEKMKDCRWLTPLVVERFEFVEWTSDSHLRHARYVGLREERKARGVRAGARRCLDVSDFIHATSSRYTFAGTTYGFR